MEVLQWEFSDKFSQYMEWFRSVSKKRVHFYYTNQHPDPAVHARQAMVEVDPNQARVFIQKNIGVDLAEENTAHELTHLALIEEGFCYPVVTDGRDVQWQQVANALLSWTADVLIDLRLETFGYDNRVYQHMVWKNTKEHLELYPRESKAGAEEIFNALGYFYCCQSVTQIEWNELKELYEKVDPPAYRLGEMIIQLSQEYDISQVEGYCSFLRDIRDACGLVGIIGIFSPITEDIS